MKKNISQWAVSTLICAVALIGLMAGTARAGSVFSVDKVDVDVSAATTIEARNQALAEGQQRALEIVMKRLVRIDDWPRLPPVASAKDIQNIVEGFRVSDEKTGRGRYIARMSVQFKPGPLRRLLRGYNLPLNEDQARTALLVPVLEDLRGLQAWGDHWWRQSWLAQDLNNVAAPLALPLGDMEDALIASPEDILIGSPDKLLALNERYDTQTVIVAHALADVDGQLGVTAYIFNADSSDVIVRTYRTGGAHGDMADMAVAELMSVLSERWKQVAVVASDEETSLPVLAEFSSLKQWVMMLRELEAASLVQVVDVREMSSRQAWLDLSYIGSIEQLSANLQQRDLELVEDRPDDGLQNDIQVEGLPTGETVEKPVIEAKGTDNSEESRGWRLAVRQTGR